MANGRSSVAQMSTTIGLVLLGLLFLNVKSVEPKTFIVGDAKGWSSNMQDWPKGKTFHPGDFLEFGYKKGEHTVFQVNLEGYEKCDGTNAIYGSNLGDTTIKLPAGTSYFICTIPPNCQKNGMKMVVETI